MNRRKTFAIIQQKKDDVVILKLQGELDSHGAPALDKSLQKLLDRGVVKVVADCSALDYISSAAAGIFIVTNKTLREKGGRLVLTGLSDNVDSVFELLGIKALFVFADSNQKALACF